MNLRRRFAPIAALVALFVAPVAAGQDGAVDVEQLIRELRATQQQVSELNEEVADLRARTGDNWMTEERASEIRTLVADVLHDADHRASLLQGGDLAGWNDGFYLSDPDGEFTLNIDGQLQFRFLYRFKETDDEDPHRYGTEVTRAALTLRGNAFGQHLKYLVRIDQTRNEPEIITGLYFLKDAWVRWQLTDRWSVQFGQFKAPFNREELVSASRQLAVERSVVNESTNLGRTQGVQLTYADRNIRWSVMASDGGTDNMVGIIDPGGDPIQDPALIDDVEYALTSRFEWKAAGTWEQFEDFTSPADDPFGLLLGAAIHWQKGEYGIPAFIKTEEEWWGYTLDLSMEFGGANLFLSWVQHRIEAPTFDVNYYGIVLHGGYYILPDIELFARAEWGQTTTTLSGIAFETLKLGTVGFNYYLEGHKLKWTNDIGFTVGKVPSSYASDITGFSRDFATDLQLVFRSQFQLLF